ncbi:MAG: TRAP-type mannitol/chloroaromatic compound transport system, small permease component [Proteobacteria bacterium]|nr:TRAP-type mannitol/chloroaromatic compound transport system, small permease component [Pseudomonadota bacterium]
MQFFLKLSGLIDAMSERVCKMVMWLVLAMTLLSSFNAMMRYTINYSSNAWLEMQWYLFAAVFMLMAGYGLLKNAHIRIDVLAGHFPHKVQGWIDVVCFFLFLTPMVVGIFYLSLPAVIDSVRIGEMSPSPGGLVRWPVRVILPLGLILLFIQGISEVIKKIAYLTGHLPDPYAHEHEMTAEEKLAADLKAEQEKKGALA